MLKAKYIRIPTWTEAYYIGEGHGNFTKGLRIVAYRAIKTDSKAGRPPKNKD